MSAPLRPSILPQCASCTRRLTKFGLQEWRPSQQQVRGKKKLANVPTTVTVRLLKDVQFFGRKGAFVPISIGQMRNEWFPRRVAEYVTDTQLKDLKTRNVTAERDFQFGMVEASPRAGQSNLASEIRAQLAAQRTSKAAIKTVEIERLTPERSVELLNILVPARLDFYRQLIEATPAPAPAPEPTRQHQKARQSSASGAAADLLAARSQAAKAPAAPVAAQTAIYGSVSIADIANAVKAIIAENDEASKIIFAEEDVRFVNMSVEGAEADKLKNIGEFEVEIKIKGADAVVKKHIRVLPQEKQE